MSLSTIKRLFGETSLERKCRLFLGGGFLVLILLSFLLAGWRTEQLVWDQTRRAGQQLASHVIQEQHLWALADIAGKGSASTNPASPPTKGDVSALKLRDDVMVVKLRNLLQSESSFLPDTIDKYQSRLVRPNLSPERTPAKYRPIFDWVQRGCDRLRNEGLDEVSGSDEKTSEFNYLRAVRIQTACLSCHPTTRERNEFKIEEYKAGDMMAAISIVFNLADNELRVNVNRAILMSFAVGTAAVAMLFAYIIVRFVIVKPVAHLKQVTDEIAAGNLTIRSDVKTGDEFQELSVAFNRMIRNLVAMQEELRRVNADLDQRLDDLAKANMSLFELNRLKSEFLATISHELRTPLNSILGFGDLLAEGDGMPEKKKRWVQNIQNSGKVLLALINDILDLAKLEAGKMQLHIEEFSLRDLVEGQAAMLRPMADQKNIVLTTEVEPAIPILRQDGKKLAQILSNLLSNAIKFTPEGGQIHVTARADRAHFRLGVRDNGVGIAPEDQKLVFEKFRQAESGLTRHHGGTGLGLSIVRELTKLLGGDDVELESQLGRGSTFSIRLPMQLSERPSEELSLGRGGVEALFDARRPDVRYFSSRPAPAAAESVRTPSSPN